MYKRINVQFRDLNQAPTTRTSHNLALALPTSTMSSDAQAVVKYNDAIAEVSGGANDVNDFVFQYW